MQLRCHARECECIWAVPHRRDPYRVSDIDGWWSRQNQSRARSRARVESDGARRSTTAPDMCGYGSDAPSKPDDAWRSPPRASMSWYGETACSLHGLQETEHVTGSAAFCLDAGESGGPHAGCTQGFTQSHSRTHTRRGGHMVDHRGSCQCQEREARRPRRAGTSMTGGLVAGCKAKSHTYVAVPKAPYRSSCGDFRRDGHVACARASL
ncbi:hypothetical protein BKA56DRAFT_220287 [Ilyonectria sp. MPI-CAGE-AT-0026]|nr:hypothetical protein BKA56DRAFT_220287 [Ilyonectria sp. MPI-CAGE-AT-0026]